MSEEPEKRRTDFHPYLPDETSVKLIGLGGVGSISARYLAVFMASLGCRLRLVLIDGDKFEPGNAARMLFSSLGNKAAVIRSELLPRFSETSLMLMAVEKYITPQNIERIVHDNDIVILTVDNHATRKLVSNHCRRLENVVLMSGGNDGVGNDTAGRRTRGTYGNCQIYIRIENRDISPPITRFHPEIQTPADKLPDQLACTELIQSVPQILFANLAAASAILNAFWLLCCNDLHYSEIAFDIADGLMRPVMRLTDSDKSFYSPDGTFLPIPNTMAS